ncbi:MAG: ceramidase domain-containing protein [Candidatus Hodarchaeota archaeon]
MNISEYKYFLGGLLFFAISMVIFFSLALAGWPCPPEICVIHENPFCEELQIGNIKQPISTFSNLSLVISGLVILIFLGKTRDDKENALDNPMAGPTFFSILYAFITIFIGVGSMMYHASLTSYGGFLDEYAMVLYMAFLIIYTIIRLAKQTEKGFITIYVPTILILAYIMIAGLVSGVLIFTVMVAVAFFLELFLQIAIRRLKSFKWIYRDWKWLAMGFGTFLLGFIVWLFTNAGDPLCFPYSWFQGHAIWHIAVGLATYFLFIYARTEKVKSI